MNFSDSDFDYIEHFGGSKRISLPRDSVLLNFDPLCSKPSVIQKIQRLGVTQEEPETKDDNSFKQEQASEENSIDSRASGPPNSSIVAEHEMSMMKDLSAEAKIDINHSEDRKFKWVELSQLSLECEIILWASENGHTVTQQQHKEARAILIIFHFFVALP